MQTRRSKRAAEAALPPPPPSSSPQPAVRRNPRRTTTRKPDGIVKARNSAAAADSDSDASPSPSSLLSSPPVAISSPSRLHLPTSSSSSSSSSSSPRLDSSSSPASATATATAAAGAAVPPPTQLTPSLSRPNSSPTPPDVQVPKGLTSVPRKGSIIWDPKPRRGAPRNLSISSLFSTPKRDYTDDEDREQTPSSPPKSATELLAEKMAQREIEETEVEIWLEATTALARDAKNVISMLEDKNTARHAYKQVLQMKIKAFEMSRSIFTGPQPSFRTGSRPEIPFLNWNWVNKIEDEDILDIAKKAVPLAIKMANIATALLQIRAIENEGYDPVPFLEATDTSFPQSFAADESKHFLHLSLEIRTQRAIESIAVSPQATDLRGMLGYAFCAMNAPNAPNNYNALFAYGPYKPMAGLSDDELLDVCSERVKDIWQLMSEDGKRGIRAPVDLPSVRAKYPLPNTLELLKKWLLHRYLSVSQLLERAEQEQIAKEKRMLLEQWRAEEELRIREEIQAREGEQRAREEERRIRDEERRLREEERRAREEQNLRVREEALEKERQAWEREKPLRARQSGETRSREERDRNKQPPPPDDEDSLFLSDSSDASPRSLASSQGESQRPQIQRGGDNPSREDSLFHRSEMTSLLRKVSLAGSFSNQTQQKLPASMPSRTRPHQGSRRHNGNSNYDEEEEEGDQRRDDSDDDDDFETDRRPVKRTKTTNVPSPSAPGPRQRRKEYKEAAATAATAATSGYSRSAAAPPSSSMLDFTEIERIKDQARTNARLNNPRPLKRRQIWSERDSITLIELVASRAAGWADMEKEDSHRFEFPRNAQAYRDRARNMKVDFLISDAVLPLGFDLVSLSKKENNRLQMLGKNPARMEADVDRNGRPTKTKYVPLEAEL